MHTVVVAFIGEDGPGLVHALAEVLSDHQGNWENSHMASIGGLFAGVLEVRVAADRCDALVEDFRALDGMFELIVRPAGDSPAPADKVSTLEVTGPDGTGIIERFAATLARSRLTVQHFASETRVDAGRPFLHFTSSVAPCEGVVIEDLRGELDDLRRELGVDVVVTSSCDRP